MKLFKLKDFLTYPSDDFHFAKVTYTSKKELSMHNHDYYEVFWIEKGTGFHHINGYMKKLEKGDLIMIRPDDTHTFSASHFDTNGLTITNLAFNADTVIFFKNRYFPDTTTFFWSRECLPFQTKLSDEDLTFLAMESEKLVLKQNNKLILDYILNIIMRMSFEQDQHRPVYQNIPYWLSRAIERFNSVEYLKTGATGFARLCNRSIDHTNRVLKNTIGNTLTETINKIKMNYAANQLIMTNSPVKNISHQCGYKNIGHFYKVFKDFYNITPVKYRKINQKII